MKDKDKCTMTSTKSRQQGTLGEMASGGSRTSRSDVNANTEALDSQHCQAMAMLSSSFRLICTRKRLLAGLCPDLLGPYSAPMTP